MNQSTHYLVVDPQDHSVLAWFPKTEEDALDRATFMGRDTLNFLANGTYAEGQGFTIDGIPWLP